MSYEQFRVSATKYKSGQSVFVVISVRKVSNTAKLVVNRKHAIVMDPVGMNLMPENYPLLMFSSINTILQELIKRNARTGDECDINNSTNHYNNNKNLKRHHVVYCVNRFIVDGL